MRSRGQFARSSSLVTDPVERRRSRRARAPARVVERQQVRGPEQQARRRLEAAEDHGGALVTDLVAGERCSVSWIARGQQHVEHIAMRVGVRRALAGRHHLIDSGEPDLLKRTSLAQQEAERRLRRREAIDDAGPPGPATNRRTRPPSLSRGALSGSENIARSAASKAAAWNAADRSAIGVPPSVRTSSSAVVVKCGSSKRRSAA